MPRRLGILAGGGRLPRLLIDACEAAGRPYTVIAFDGQADPDLVAGPNTHWMRLGAGARILATLSGNGVEDIVLAGSITRPTLRQLRPDLWGVKFLMKTGALAKGDDGLLRELLKAFEENGMAAVGVHDVLPQLLSPAGVLTRREPTEEERRDITVALHAALDLGRQDKGQGAIAAAGNVLATEGPAGTDAMLKSLSGAGQGGVLVKCAKPVQDLRADLPTAGLETVINAHAAGLAGIALEAGRSLLLQQEETIAEADRLGLFLIGINVEEVSGE